MVVSNNESLEFLELLQSDLKRAARLFAEWANRRLNDPRFPILRSLTSEDRHECSQEILLHFIKDNARVLLSYQKQSAKFQTWFSVVASHKALDFIRARNLRATDPIEKETEDGFAEIPVLAPTPSPHAALEWKEAKERTKQAFKQLGPQCRLLLRLASKGYKPKEMVPFFPHLKWDNVQAGNALHYCREQMRQQLAALGVNIDDYFVA